MSVNSNQLRDFLKLVNKHFPLPNYWDDGSEFRGNHGIVLNREDGRLHMGIWCYDKENRLVSWPIIFDEEGEDFTEDLLLEVKGVLEEKGAKYLGGANA